MVFKIQERPTEEIKDSVRKSYVADWNKSDNLDKIIPDKIKNGGNHQGIK